MFVKGDQVCINGLTGYKTYYEAGQAGFLLYSRNIANYGSFTYATPIQIKIGYNFNVEEFIQLPTGEEAYILSDQLNQTYFLFDNTVAYEMIYNVSSFTHHNPFTFSAGTNLVQNQQMTIDELIADMEKETAKDKYPIAGKVEITLEETGEIVAGVIVHVFNVSYMSNSVYKLLLDHKHEYGFEMKEFGIPEGYGIITSHQFLKFTGETDWKIERSMKKDT